jgi:hypothetical protein
MRSLGRRGEEWQARLLGLREALGELYAAEADALSRDLSRWGKGFLGAVLLLLAALTIAFWLVAVLVGLMIAVIAIWLPVWAATLITFVVLLAVVAALAWVGWRRMERLGGPLGRIKRRWRDHWDWWNERVLATDEEPAAPAAWAAPRAGGADDDHLA